MQTHRGFFRFPPMQAATLHIQCTCEIVSQWSGQEPTFPFVSLLSLSFIICLFWKEKKNKPKANQTTTKETLCYFTGEEISAKHLFHWQGWVTAPPLPPTQLNPAPGQPESQEEMKRTCLHPPPAPALWQKRFSASAINHPRTRRGAREGDTCFIFSQTNCTAKLCFLNLKKFWKGNALEVHSMEFSHHSSELCHTQARA